MVTKGERVRKPGFSPSKVRLDSPVTIGQYLGLIPLAEGLLLEEIS